jgi:hypothetical protein
MVEPTGDQRDEPARQADPESNTDAGRMLLVQKMLRDWQSTEAERADERRERDEERRLREAKSRNENESGMRSIEQKQPNENE